MQKILLIEDDDQLRRNTAEILELSNYEVYTAENGKIGVEKALQCQPDLVICDLMMPVLDGYGVLKVLHKNPVLNTIPVILLTAKSERGDFRKGMELGADDYLTKPFDEVELISAIETRLSKVEHQQHSVTPQTNVVEEAHVSANFNYAYLTEGLQQLLEDKRPHHYKKKSVIYAEGDDATRLYYVQSGKVKVILQNNEGKELVTGLYKVGDFVGIQSLLSGSAYVETAVALEETELLYVPKDLFLQAIHQNRAMANGLIQWMAQEIIQQEKYLLGLAYNSLRKRVAESLVFYAKHIHPDQTVDIIVQLSREDLASIAGTATESLIRTLSDFKQEGLIEITSGKVIILDLLKIQHLRY